MKLITFEDIFSGPVDPPSIVLIEGEAGTLKSSICFSLMLDLLKNPENTGLYITLEQTWESHLVNMKSLGLKPLENLLSLDFKSLGKSSRVMRQTSGFLIPFWRC